MAKDRKPLDIPLDLFRMLSYMLYVRPAKVNNPEAVQKILIAYFSTVIFEVNQGKLTGRPWEYTPCEPNDYDWPEAALHELFDVDFPDPDLLARVVLSNHGDEGFQDLLSDLGPYLDSPLTIQAVSRLDEGNFVAREWHVAPRSTQVEINGFAHFHYPVPERVTAYTASNVAEVDDLEAVKRILGNYLSNFTGRARLQKGSDKPVLSIHGDDRPLALNLDKYGLRNASADVREAYLEMDPPAEGDKGFLELLRELAPHFKTPLTVQSDWDPSDLRPRVLAWQVQPGSTEIQFQEVSQRTDNGAESEEHP